jgi:TolB-like protein
MKRCPQCNQVAFDQALTFCRADGVRFIQDSDSFDDRETVVLRPEAPARVTSITDESLTVPAAATTLLDSSEGSTSCTQLDHQEEILFRSAAVSALAIVTFADRACYSLSSKRSMAIYSLAVLPFINVNADQQFDYLSDRVTEMLICNLSQLPKLNVKAYSSVFRYKGKNVTPHTAGADLNVQAVLNGRLTQRGDVLTLSLELVDAYTENVMWSVQYNCKQTEFVSLHSEIVRDVSNYLQVKLAYVDEQMLSKSCTIDTDACQLYVKEHLYGNNRILKALEEALEHFYQTIALDPGYAPDHAGLTDTYVLLPIYRNGPVHVTRPLAREAMIKALPLNGD